MAWLLRWIPTRWSLRSQLFSLLAVAVLLTPVGYYLRWPEIQRKAGQRQARVDFEKGDLVFLATNWQFHFRDPSWRLLYFFDQDTGLPLYMFPNSSRYALGRDRGLIAYRDAYNAEAAKLVQGSSAWQQALRQNVVPPEVLVQALANPTYQRLGPGPTTLAPGLMIEPAGPELEELRTLETNLLRALPARFQIRRAGRTLYVGGQTQVDWGTEPGFPHVVFVRADGSLVFALSRTGQFLGITKTDPTNSWNYVILTRDAPPDEPVVEFVYTSRSAVGPGSHGIAHFHPWRSFREPWSLPLEGWGSARDEPERGPYWSFDDGS